MYKFSIVVPCYNVENRVDELFEMLSSSEYDGYEVLFVDDCSRDNSFSIMETKAAAYDNYRVYRTQQNGGPGIARNVGLKYANGEYIIFCDSDDRFDVTVLSKLDAFLSEHPNADLLVSPHRVVQMNGSSNVDLFNGYQHGDGAEKRDVMLGPLAPWAKVYRADIIKKYKIAFPARYSGEDICFVVNYIVRCNAIYKFAVCYYEYIMVRTSITHGKTAEEKTTFEILQPIYHAYFPDLETRMFAQSHLLTKAKFLTGRGAGRKELKQYFAEQNAKYPDWIKHVEFEKQSIYRKLIFYAMYYNRPLMIKLIMFVRRMLY